jgi:transcriptional regulator GlxA family with amidase domain
LLVAGVIERPEEAADPALVEWVAVAANQARRVGAMGSAVVLLAHAGLLDGRMVTVHPAAASRFAQQWPNVGVSTGHSVVRDGKIFTALGVEAGLDLALELVADDFGAQAAAQLAQQLQICRKQMEAGWPPACLRLAARACIRDIQAYVQKNLAADLSVTELAARAGMSDRNFARVFVRETGVTPSQFVRNQRVSKALQLLSQPACSIQQVARLCGFGETGALRRSVIARLGVTPKALKGSAALKEE